ncbi:tRNA synthetase class II core domain (G, H, P, S and T) [Actinokineospora alba]|uniref:tRNA synthetase class II core domain (G, H, P, S and T) n=1 Tax=Actinokineospora alba TaxID=504798 RepID=A0A1H0FVG5_9PSEU|nr:aminoacyl--tRNA ligase-related protein [Actinokineospora alba]TDP69634.1 tRNA synthetase class II (G, H, P, S and T) [Actinokineospora alba]SDI12465.1 tRNA synthetase class II core domain (G, H, P, S and T) [Actinokineospora alba]SDN98552.1 tRNA synthetase class II core domain (G, H, P, S and T) [Actinokineospora alba]
MTTATDNGLSVLDGDQLRLLRAIEAVFLRLADGWNAQEFRYPHLIRCSDLDKFDYYDNFPHLGLAAVRLDPARLGASLADAERPLQHVVPEVMEPTAFALPSAACYSIYVDLAGSVLPAEGVLRTTVGTCFRNEDHYSGLRRLLGFSMREIVCVGPEDAAKAHLARAKDAVIALLVELGIEYDIEVATDPFFDKNSGKAKMQKLFPVKEEFVVDGLAIGSVNYHRNFFGERCSIQVGEETAHTSCLAFGLERWIHTLTDRFGGAVAALAAVEALG